MAPARPRAAVYEAGAVCATCLTDYHQRACLLHHMRTQARCLEAMAASCAPLTQEQLAALDHVEHQADLLA